MVLTFVTGAVCLLRDQRVLTVRKGGTRHFQLPGGKLEAGESALQAAVREVGEEIGVDLDPRRLTLVGAFEDQAANEPGARVHATVYLADADHTDRPMPLDEIAELRWVDPTATPTADLAPLLARQVLPAVAAQLS